MEYDFDEYEDPASLYSQPHQQHSQPDSSLPSSQTDVSINTRVSSKKVVSKRDLCMVLDKYFFDSDITLRVALSTDFRLMTDDNDNNAAGTKDEKFPYIPVDGMPVRNVVVWTSISSLIPQSQIPILSTTNHHDIASNSTSASCHSSLPMVYSIASVRPIAAIFFSCDLFVESALKSIDDFDFSHLAAEIHDTLATLRSTNIYEISSATADAPRLVLMLVGMDKVVLAIQKKLIKNKINRSVINVVENAIPYILYELNVEVVRWKNMNETVNYLNTLTRIIDKKKVLGVGTGSTQQQSSNEIEHVMKASKRKLADGIIASAAETERFELRETWSAMLQMMPQLSTRRAQTLVDNSKYSCLKKCFDALNDESKTEKQRENLLAECFVDGIPTAVGTSTNTATNAAAGAGVLSKTTKKSSHTRLVKLSRQVFKSLSKTTSADAALDS